MKLGRADEGGTMAVITEIQATTVSWEPCSAFHDDPAAVDGCCAGCGWAPDDHPVDRAVDRDVELPAAA
jgi:hypothetical protein